MSTTLVTLLGFLFRRHNMGLCANLLLFLLG